MKKKTNHTSVLQTLNLNLKSVQYQKGLLKLNVLGKMLIYFHVNDTTHMSVQ